MNDVLDPVILDRLQRELGGDPQRVAAILAVFRDEIEPCRADLRAAAERNDTDDTIFGAHRLGSASVLMGATKLSALCRELESLSQDALNHHGRDLVAQIDHESTAVISAIGALLTTSATPG
jgi:HPt (histidine-containing phosphotransfer) domain-containing protein